MKRVAVLGSTGSIGTSCLTVLETLSDRLEAVALTANRVGNVRKEKTSFSEAQLLYFKMR